MDITPTKDNGGKNVSNLIPHDDINYEEFLALYHQASKSKPKAEDLNALQIFLDNHPELVTDTFSLTNRVLNDLIETQFQKKSDKLLMRQSTQRMKEEYGYSQASIIDRMMFDNILINWVRLQYLEGKYNEAFQKGWTDTEAHFYTEILNAANLRFNRSVEALGRLKKYNINFQVNIATDGGQQINVQQNRK